MKLSEGASASCEAGLCAASWNPPAAERAPLPFRRAPARPSRQLADRSIGRVRREPAPMSPHRSAGLGAAA